MLEQVREGNEVLIDDGHRSVAVIREPQSAGRSIDECIAIAEAFEARQGYAPVPDEDFARDVQEGVNANREALEPPAWD